MENPATPDGFTMDGVTISLDGASTAARATPDTPVAPDVQAGAGIAASLAAARELEALGNRMTARVEMYGRMMLDPGSLFGEK